MCYSAQLASNLRTLERTYGAQIDWLQLRRTFEQRAAGDKIRISSSVEANFFRDSANPDEAAIVRLVDAHRASERERMQKELFKQRRRLADAERVLATKTTKTAAKDKEIATKKCADLIEKLARLDRTATAEQPHRIFSSHWAPVIVSNSGDERRIVLARYLCRPPGAPAFYDQKFSGCFNARSDSLGGFWSKHQLFGHPGCHGIALIYGFFENVQVPSKTAPGGSENAVLHFQPQSGEPMIVPILFSEWRHKDEALDSWALITRDPPPEVAAAGHDRCPVSLRPENVPVWLAPHRHSTEELQAVLEDPLPAYYEHKLAA